MRSLMWGALSILTALPAGADTYVRQPQLDVVHYQIEIELSDGQDTIQATTRIQVRARRDGLSKMWLDLTNMTVESVKVGSSTRPFVHRDGHLSFELDRAYNEREIAPIEVRYAGKAAGDGLLATKNKYGRSVYFAENWPDRARTWFPCIDHPSDKATVEIAVVAPERYEIVANGRLVEVRSLLDGRKATRWSESQPIPTYCMVFGAAEFSVTQNGIVAGVPSSFYAYPQDREAAARKFARSGLALQFFSERIGPYPYEKLAHVQSSTRIGGMENASAIFYNEAAFQVEPVRENPVPHEIAHQWFGNSISLKDWDHLWISEGFATYFSSLFYEHLEGPETLKRQMEQAAQSVRAYHGKRPAAIVDPELTDLPGKLNPFNYQKGAWVLHMLRKILGDDVFFGGIRRYYAIYSGSNSSSEDFESVMEAVSGIPLRGFFRQWLHQPGWPDYRVDWQWLSSSGEAEIRISQQQAGGLYDMPLDLVFGVEGGKERQTVRVSGREERFRIRLPERPVSLDVDPDNWVLKTVQVTAR